MAFKGGKAVTSGGTKLQKGAGVGPKLGRNLSSVGPRVGSAVMGGSNTGGGAAGKAAVRAGPKGMAAKGLMNR